MKTNYNATTLMVAENQIKELMERFDLRPEILDYFKQGTIAYSYITPDVIGIGDISENPECQEAVKQFEATYSGYHVYYAIKRNTEFGRLLSLLYVEDSKRPKRVRKDGYIYTYVVNLDCPDWSEFGYIKICNYMGSRVLTRIE